MENKTVEMVVKDLLLADNRKKKKKGKLCSKFGEDRSKTELTILAVARRVDGYRMDGTDTGRTPDGR